MVDKFPVVELFGPTIQGEGALCGKVSYFLRTGGCSLKCVWCDSMHAVLPKEVKKNATYMNEDDIVTVLSELSTTGHRKDTWITLTGGDPVMWDFTALTTKLHFEGFQIAVETQGSLYNNWLEHCNLVTCSPKGPSSGMLHKLKYEVLDKYVRWLEETLVFKVVAFTKADLDFAESIHLRYPKIPFYMTSGTPTLSAGKTDNLDRVSSDVLIGYRWLTAEVLKRSALHDATISPQMHTLVWARAVGH